MLLATISTVAGAVHCPCQELFILGPLIVQLLLKVITASIGCGMRLYIQLKKAVAPRVHVSTIPLVLCCCYLIEVHSVVYNRFFIYHSPPIAINCVVAVLQEIQYY